MIVDTSSSTSSSFCCLMLLLCAWLLRRGFFPSFIVTIKNDDNRNKIRHTHNYHYIPLEIVNTIQERWTRSGGVMMTTTRISYLEDIHRLSLSTIAVWWERSVCGAVGIMLCLPAAECPFASGMRVDVVVCVFVPKVDLAKTTGWPSRIRIL